MAIYSLSISNVSRAAGSSSLATLSYITASKVRDERLGQTFYGFGRRERVEAVGTLLPQGAPVQWRDPEVLFNAIEAHEKASNARVGKKIIIALAREWSLEKSEEVLREYIAAQLVSRGYAATYAIHTDAQGNNPHAHVLIANRVISKQGKWSAKSKAEYVLDDEGNRVPLIDPATGEQKLGKRNEKQWKRRKVSYNPLDQKEVLKELRRAWADTANSYLDEGERIDHRSLKEQGIDRLPQIHLGYAAAEMEKRGEPSERVERAENIRKTNERIEEVGRLEALIEQVRKAREEALIVLRSAIDHVLSDRWLYKVTDFVDRLKNLGISVKTQAKDWVYRIEHGISQGGEASGEQLGKEYTKDAIEKRLKGQGEALAGHYDARRVSELEARVRAIETSGLDSEARERLNRLQQGVRGVIAPVIEANRAAEQAGMFKRRAARENALQAAQRTQAELSQIAPWWSREITPENAQAALEAIQTRAEQNAKADALQSLEGLKTELEAQGVYKDAREHVQLLAQAERYHRWGIFTKPDMRKPHNPTSHPTLPPPVWGNQNRHGRSR